MINTFLIYTIITLTGMFLIIVLSEIFESYIKINIKKSYLFFNIRNILTRIVLGLIIVIYIYLSSIMNHSVC